MLKPLPKSHWSGDSILTDAVIGQIRPKILAETLKYSFALQNKIETYLWDNPEVKAAQPISCTSLTMKTTASSAPTIKC